MLKPLQRLLLTPSTEHVASSDSALLVTVEELTQGRRAHRDWHHHLVACLTGRATDVLHPEEICFDDRCTFGHWLRAMGEKRLGAAGYAALNRHHKLLHLHAANVVSFRLGGHLEKARILFKGGYADASRALLNTLDELEAQCRPTASRKARRTRHHSSRLGGGSLRPSEAPATI